jgi:hypothetical protein
MLTYATEIAYADEDIDHKALAKPGDKLETTQESL